MADNSTDDNSNPVDINDFGAFEKAFLGNEVPAEAESEEVEVDENEEDSLAPEDTEAPDGDDGDDGEPEAEEEESEEEPKPEAKKNRKSFQKRIDELVADARQAERERDLERREREALLRKVEELEARAKVETPESKTVKESLSKNGPQPDDVDDDGNPVYPLGEFDKKFISDLTKFTIEQERETFKTQEAERQQAEEAAKVQEALKADWAGKLAEAEKEIPDIRTNIQGLTEAFTGIEPSYGEYLAMTIMTCQNGPEIMNYLSQNIGEAQKIVASGPAAATLMIGRLDDHFDKPVKESTRNKVSEAPIPPVERVRGRGSRTEVRGDTNDLNAFEREFYRPK